MITSIDNDNIRRSKYKGARNKWKQESPNGYTLIKTELSCKEGEIEHRCTMTETLKFSNSREVSKQLTEKARSSA